MTDEKISLRLGFDPFGHNSQTEVLGQPYSSGADRGIVLVGLDISDEGSVKFQSMNRQHLQVGKRGIAGAKIIDREFHAAIAPSTQVPDGPFRIFHGDGLCNLQF